MRWLDRSAGRAAGRYYGLIAALLVSALAAAASPSRLPVEEITLDNGMRFLLLRRDGAPTVAAGWVAQVGSVNERPGITGLTHFLEHMLFKGTETIGARDRAREQPSLDEQERLQEAMRGEYSKLRAGARAGEIDDPFGRGASTPELEQLRQSYQRELERARGTMAPGELWRTYTEAGGRGLNALTMQDMTLYTVTLPAEKLELWFWMESDRLLAPVFRDFYTERAVVAEERRQRTESTATGRFDVQLKSLFWGGHPYGWPTLGWPSDLTVLSRADAQAHFDTFYGPGNLVAVVVGDFDAAQAKVWAAEYFGRLKPRPAPPEVVTVIPEQLAEQRLNAVCDCRSQVQVLYRTVPMVHKDRAALEVLAGVLNGRTGRLYRSLVESQGLASSAFAMQAAMKWSGQFSFSAESKAEATGAALLAAWDRELDRLVQEGVTDEELVKVKNQIAADSYRRLKDSSALAMQLLMSSGFGDWRLVEESSRQALAVTGEDVRRALSRHLRPENRTVGAYSRKAAPVPAGGGS